MHEREYDLYRLESYRSLGAWKEFFDLVSILWLLVMMTVGVLFLSIANATTGIRPYDIIFTFGFATAVSVGATVMMIGMKHPNEWVNRGVAVAPIVVALSVLLTG